MIPWIIFFKATTDGTAAADNNNSVQEKSAGRLSSFFAKKRRLHAPGGVGPDGDGAENATGFHSSPEQRFKTELNRYIDIPSVSMDVNVRLWWKERVDNYPLLQSLARKYLSIPASSTTSERLFSVGGNVITDTRCCLSDEHAEQLIFLASNRRFLKKR